jgi:hypothetical protein
VDVILCRNSKDEKKKEEKRNMRKRRLCSYKIP